jgi:hypothetical protein
VVFRGPQLGLGETVTSRIGRQRDGIEKQLARDAHTMRSSEESRATRNYGEAQETGNENAPVDHGAR